VYHEYVRVFLGHLKPFFRELTSRRRRVTKWVSKKKLQKALDELADRLAFERTAKTEVIEQKGQEKTEKTEVIEQKGQEKTDQAPRKRVIFFGDGSFKPQRRYVTPPRKKLVKYIAHRALIFVLSERGTSKYCPISGDEMIDVPGSYRFRRCSCDLTGEDPCRFATKCIDRDECATLSMCLCAHQAMTHHTRPVQYCC
jgi:hypothetical protein